VRSRSELAEVILDGLRWLGIESDEPVVYQSDHQDVFATVAGNLWNAARPIMISPRRSNWKRCARSRRHGGEPMFRFRGNLDRAREETPARLQRGEPYANRLFRAAEDC